MHTGSVGGVGALPRRRSVRDRHQPGGERDPPNVHRKKELALHWASRRWMAQCSDLQSVHHSPPLWSRSGRVVGGCLATDPVLHPGQLDRVAALELEAAGGLSPDCASERWRVRTLRW